MHNGIKQQPPSEFTHMPFDFYDFPQDMYVEETFEQGGACTTPSLFGPDKNPPWDQNTQNHFPKLDMHKFEGFDLAGWVSQMEHYFQLYNFTDPKTKLKVGVLYLDVECFRWWQWHMRSIGGRPIDWTCFSKALCAHFDQESDFLACLTKLKHIGLVKDFITAFEQLVIRVISLVDSFYV